MISGDLLKTNARKIKMEKDVQISVNNDETIIVSNDNTTIGYATIDVLKSELTYLFVNPLFRRQGYGNLLLNHAERVTGLSLKPAEPISPLGRKFFSHNSRD